MPDYKEYIIRVYPNYTEYGKMVAGEFQLHREDGPAREYADGNKYWFLNGKAHREDGPAFEYANGHKRWYLNGKCHREDGPAIEYADGNKYWFLNGKYHREDGPAIEYANGTKFWYLNGKYYSEADFKLKMQKKQTPTCDGKVVESTKLIAKIENLCLEIDGKKYKLTALSKT